MEGVIFLGSIRYESLKKVYDGRVSVLLIKAVINDKILKSMLDCVLMFSSSIIPIKHMQLLTVEHCPTLGKGNVRNFIFPG